MKNIYKIMFLSTVLSPLSYAATSGTVALGATIADDASITITSKEDIAENANGYLEDTQLFVFDKIESNKGVGFEITISSSNAGVLEKSGATMDSQKIPYVFTNCTDLVVKDASDTLLTAAVAYTHDTDGDGDAVTDHYDISSGAQKLFDMANPTGHPIISHNSGGHCGLESTELVEDHQSGTYEDTVTITFVSD